MLEKLEKYIKDKEILAIIGTALIVSVLLILFSSIIVPLMVMATILIAIYLVYTRIREINQESQLITTKKEVEADVERE